MRAVLDNPIVTRSLRTRLRGARAAFIPGAYLAVMIVILFVLLYAHGTETLTGPEAMQIFFWVAFAINLLVLVFVTAVNTANYFSQEKTQRTLDFLRISRLSPTRIILGHLIGGLTLPVVLAAVTFPLVAFAASWVGFPWRVLVQVSALLIMYTVIASAFALAVALVVKKASLAGGTVVLPMIGLLILGFLVQASTSFTQMPWPLAALAFVAPTMFVFPLVWTDTFRAATVPDLFIFGHTVDAFVFNMAMVLLFSVLLVHGVARKVERSSKAFLSHGQATIVATIFLSVIFGVLASIVMKPSIGAGIVLSGSAQLSILLVNGVLAIFGVLVLFLIVTAPTRERIIRGALRRAHGDRPRSFADESRAPWLQTLLLVVLAGLGLYFLGKLGPGRLAPAMGPPLLVLALLVTFYALLVQELKLAFPRSYKAWLGMVGFILWVVLPGAGQILLQFEATKTFSWPFGLSSPYHGLLAAFRLVDSTLAPGPIPAGVFLAISGGLHLLGVLAMALHLPALRRAIPRELERIVEGTRRVPGEGVGPSARPPAETHPGGATA